MLSTKRLSIVGVGAAITASILVGGKAHAATFTYTKIVDTSTPVPGGLGNFELFDPPSLEGKNVAFRGYGFGSQSGIYTNIGNSINLLNNTNDPNPKTEAIRFFNLPSIDNGNVAYSGFNLLQQGLRDTGARIFIDFNGSPKLIADKNTSAPGGTGNFNYFGSPSLDNGNVAFFGIADPNLISGLRGIYTYIDGSLKVVADTNTLVPGKTIKFKNFANPSLNKGNVAFQGIGFDSEGIYTDLGGSLNVVADTKSAIPNGIGNFSRLDSPSLEAGNVAFRGFGSKMQRGIYTNIGGSLNVIADTNTLVPDGAGNFRSFSGLSFNNGNVAFGNVKSENPFFFDGPLEGIYTNLGGSLTKVIDINNSLDGKTIDFLGFGQEGLSGDSLAFTAYFTDGSRGIFRADAVLSPAKSVPESTNTLGVLAFGVFGVSSLLKRKQKSASGITSKTIDYT
jgi:hypothetical protein